MTTATAGKCKFQQHRSSNRTLTQFKAFCLLKQTLILTFHRVSKRNELFYTGSLWRSKDFTFCLSLTKIVLNFLLFYFCRFFSFHSFFIILFYLFLPLLHHLNNQNMHVCTQAPLYTHTCTHMHVHHPMHACTNNMHTCINTPLCSLNIYAKIVTSSHL